MLYCALNQLGKKQQETHSSLLVEIMSLINSHITESILLKQLFVFHRFPSQSV